MRKKYIEENIIITSDFDGLGLDALLYIPENVKGIVQIAHGMAEHKERYIPFLEEITRRGFVACIHDHRGHGKSVKSSDDLGYFYDNTGEAIVEDVHQISLYLKNRFKDVPLYLFGHSMGSLIVRAYTRKYDNDIDKLIVCGSPSANPLANAAIALIDSNALVKGDRYISKTITAMSVGGFNKAFEAEGENAWLSKMKQNVIDFNNDPLCGFPFTLNGYRNLIILLKNAYAKDGWAMNNPNLPIFFISGSEDPCAGGRTKWNEAIEDMKSHGYTNVKGKMYEGFRHEILNEVISDRVMDDVLDFIEEQ